MSYNHINDCVLHCNHYDTNCSSPSPTPSRGKYCCRRRRIYGFQSSDPRLLSFFTREKSHDLFSLFALFFNPTQKLFFLLPYLSLSLSLFLPFSLSYFPIIRCSNLHQRSHLKFNFHLWFDSRDEGCSRYLVKERRGEQKYELNIHPQSPEWVSGVFCERRDDSCVQCDIGYTFTEEIATGDGFTFFPRTKVTCLPVLSLSFGFFLSPLASCLSPFCLFRSSFNPRQRSTCNMTEGFVVVLFIHLRWDVFDDPLSILSGGTGECVMDKFTCLPFVAASLLTAGNKVQVGKGQSPPEEPLAEERGERSHFLVHLVHLTSRGPPNRTASLPAGLSSPRLVLCPFSSPSALPSALSTYYSGVCNFSGDTGNRQHLHCFSRQSIPVTWLSCWLLEF